MMQIMGRSVVKALPRGDDQGDWQSLQATSPKDVVVVLIIIAFNNLHRLTRSHSLPQVPIGEGGSVSREGKGGRVAKAGVAKTSIAKTKTIAVASSQVGGVSLGLSLGLTLPDASRDQGGGSISRVGKGGRVAKTSIAKAGITKTEGGVAKSVTGGEVGGVGLGLSLSLTLPDASSDQGGGSVSRVGKGGRVAK